MLLANVCVHFPGEK